MKNKENIFKNQVIYSEVKPSWYVEVEDENYNEVFLKCNFSSFENSFDFLISKTNKKLKYIIEEKRNYLEFLKKLLNLSKEKKENISEISFVLDSDLDSKKIDILFEVLNLFYDNIRVKIKLSSTNLITLNQLEKLSKIKNIKYIFCINENLEKDNIDVNLEDNIENIYTIDEMILIKIEINKILKSISKETSDFDKLQYACEHLTKNLRYDNKMVKDIAYWYETKDKGIYRVLIEKTGVCECISQAFRNLMLELNIDCRIMRSDTHSWNIVKIGNEWYSVDLTQYLNSKEAVEFIDEEKTKTTFILRKK